MFLDTTCWRESPNGHVTLVCAESWATDRTAVTVTVALTLTLTGALTLTLSLILTLDIDPEQGICGAGGDRRASGTRVYCHDL